MPRLYRPGIPGNQRKPILRRLTTLQKKIQVPETMELCEVCALTKMRNSIPKQLREHKAAKLALIQFDIAGRLANNQLNRSALQS
jgi:hypothetical protein